jgi:hypothetical protein
MNAPVVLNIVFVRRNQHKLSVCLLESFTEDTG